MARHNIIGNKGEDLAVNFLLEKGYEILERNYRFKRAEIDIIAKKDNILIAVEVKTRSTNNFGDPQDFVKPKQIKHLVTVIDQYIIKNNLNAEVQFDIVAITNKKDKSEIEHLKNAFYHF